ncbi:MAG: hypothetical protein MI866_14770 [Bacteroidales bacterium]|nr:hypothetical protein [Bacteroidales bacterium]
MAKKKCKDKEKLKNPVVKESHIYECKKCGIGSKKEDKLCKPKKIK